MACESCNGTGGEQDPLTDQFYWCDKCDAHERWIKARQQRRQELSTARERFEQKLRHELELNVFQNTQDGVSSVGIFDTLIDQLIDLAVGMLQNCLAKERSREDIAAAMSKPGPFERWALRQAVKESVVKEYRKSSESALFSVLKETPPADCVEIVKEADAAKEWLI